MTDANFGTLTLFVLAAVGFLRTLVPAAFAAVKVCLQEYFEFRVWLRRARR